MTSLQAEQVYTQQRLELDGDQGARLNSRFGLAEVVGQDVTITGQDGGGATGRVTVDAIDQARINSGKKVRLEAPIIDFVAQAVIIRGTPNDPATDDLRPGMIWFRSDLQVFRCYTGVAIKTLKLF